MLAGLPSFHTITELQAHLAPLRGDQKIAFVPTMGALHDGHLELIRAARGAADHVVVSIFVNPAQFAPHEDFNTYPRDIQQDAQKIAGLNLDQVSIFMPSVEEVYPQGQQVLEASDAMLEITSRWEGEARPHFFGGVAMVVKRLFDIVQPDLAFFGEKDFQQLQAVCQLVRDYQMHVEIHGVPIVREKTGLAMSSRNAYLNENERNQIAPQLFAALAAAARAIETGGKPQDALVAAYDQLIAAGFHQVDYIAYVDGQTLAPLPARATAPARLLAAAWLGKTRLIDNIEVT